MAVERPQEELVLVLFCYHVADCSAVCLLHKAKCVYNYVMCSVGTVTF